MQVAGDSDYVSETTDWSFCVHPRVAAVTMVFDEADLLPVWVRHYSRQVGADQCYVIDHGSSAPLAVDSGVNVLRIPRSPHDDLRRAAFIGDFIAAALRYYDWVLYTDVDELLLADPGRHPNLPAYCGSLDIDTVTAIGFDIQQVPETEAALETTRAIGAQRQWVRFTSAMCKPVLTRVPLVWSPGFHSADLLPVFDALFLFHLHWADRMIGLRRLAKTRMMPWADDGFGAHQRVSDNQWLALFDGMARLPQRDPLPFTLEEPCLAWWLSQTRQSAKLQGDQPATLQLDLNASELWPIPDTFRARL